MDCTSRWDEIQRICETDFSMPLTSKVVAVFGAGACGRTACQWMQSQNIDVACFIDDNPIKQGLLLEGVPIISLGELERFSPSLIVIATQSGVSSIKQRLAPMKIPSISFDGIIISHNLAKIGFMRNELLEDANSRLVYDALILARLSCQEALYATVYQDKQYFAVPAFSPGKLGGEYFIDAGAYTGDTIEQLFWHSEGAINKIHAFEPGKVQFKALRRRMKRLSNEWCFPKDRYVLHNRGLGSEASKENTALITPLDHASRLLGMSYVLNFGTTSQVAKMVTLDELFGPTGTLADPVSFIKADIEGMEMAMLLGGEGVIQTFRPKLAISIYHLPSDLFDIAAHLHALVPEYKMAVRHHTVAWFGTVLYCWI